MENKKSKSLRILVIGSGGREHALVRKLAASPLTEKIFVAPGNGGTAGLAENVAIAADDIEGLAGFARENGIDLVVPGPEAPLTLGVTDVMRQAGIICFGPDKYCAALEGSKIFAKEIMRAANTPTAACRVFDNVDDAREYAAKADRPLAIKADGLAGGKGVIVARDRDEAARAIDEIMSSGKFGEAAKKILIEEKLEGEEVSLLFFCDGKVAVPLPSAQDHKRVYDGDLGPNTGGMGAYSPAPCLPDEEADAVADLVARPVLAELERRGHPFRGVLYAGLMLTADGPKVLEYNVRFGDPECQPLLARLESDLVSHMLACVNGTLGEEKIVFSPKTALGVVLAAEGYPDNYPKNLKIEGLDDAADEGVAIYHSGTKYENGELASSGGRVLCATALGDDLQDARNRAYRALEKIKMPHSHFRKDIGAKGLDRLRREKKKGS
ncbi:MAG: phosphoribosylamine--glycine ligase [Desulfovibrio sp.]|nr:phosphoribosylamine--glycine ligase [Desulfovibrio sp.]